MGYQFIYFRDLKGTKRIISFEDILSIYQDEISCCLETKSGSIIKISENCFNLIHDQLLFCGVLLDTTEALEV